MTNLIAKCHVATGNLPAAILLMRIAFWMPKATREFGGHLWIAKSALDWCAETGLSFPKYRRAMALLKGPKLGFVVVERHKFGTQTITHVRLTAVGRQAVGMKETPGEQGATHAPGQCSVPTTENCTMLEAAQCPSNVGSSMEASQGANTGVQSHASRQADQKKKIPGENSKSEKISEPQSSPGILKNPIPENQKSDFENLEEGNTDVQPQHPGSVKDVQQRMTEKLHQPLKVSGLEAMWKQTLAGVQGGFVPGLTAKQRGQLKHFMQACPEGSAAAVLETVLSDWMSFTIEAEAAAGIKSSPDQPHVGFLLKHVGAAVNLHLEAMQPKPEFGGPIGDGGPAAASGVSGASKAPVQSIAASPDPDDEFDEATYEPATKAEVMAMLGIEPPPDETPADQEGGSDADQKL
jgi:hypothetical protein